MTRNTQTLDSSVHSRAVHTTPALATRTLDDSPVHSRAVHTTPALATRTLDSPVHSRAVHTTPARATRTLDSPVHTLALGTPGLIRSRHLQTSLRPPPHIPSAPLIPQSSDKVATYPLDKEGDRENKERSQGKQQEHAGPAAVEAEGKSKCEIQDTPNNRMQCIKSVLIDLFTRTIKEAFPDVPDPPVPVVPSQFCDYQCNSALPITQLLKAQGQLNLR
uniref:Uncharacterized protein n=1 Tax=Timema shepardi TaxID=629360 RepID=A0A7R9G2H0_TIMSH|nr:unnamed protein product [Timema shepardi]